MIVIGSDEAGKGEWLGPLTVAAIAITPDQRSFFITQGVMDSKELRIETILKLAEIIKKECLSYHIISISPRTFNSFLKDVKKEGKSLNDMLAWAHSKAIDKVLTNLKMKERTDQIRIIIDEFDRIKTEKRLERVLQQNGLDVVDVNQKPKAEEEIAVAAASIVARSAREYWIDSESNRLKIDLRKISVIEATGHKDAYSFAKISFLPRNKVERIEEKFSK